MKPSNKIKPEENTGKVNDEKKSRGVKKEPDDNKTQEPVSSSKAEKEAKKSISRWDTDGGVDLCQ